MWHKWPLLHASGVHFCQLLKYKYSTLNTTSNTYTNSYKYQDTMVSGTNTLASEVTRLYPDWISSGDMSQITFIFRHYQEKSMD